MNKWLSVSASVGLAVVTAGGLAGCNNNASAEGPQYADVVSATPIKKTVNHPRKECHNETVTRHKPVKDKHQIAGTAIGAVVGGLVGNQVGGGNGKKLATVAGAVGGGYAGKKIQENHQENATYTTTEQKCATVNNTSTKVVGYNVTYKYKGQTHTTRMDHDPGSRVKVSEGLSVSDAN
ncbi:glycine zipper 2TM domain-containing protein [Oleiagrimonas sp. C23AA]|uniref:glycine zipper 2TM domain-containing protein n=1 Tax=Oleiagrimonas sp. C23AA TaxID=2719047 RepID=UPI0014213387|nr:glycine zipper 2TM domain-containing protein [Oleiagrimonas sp. C23AA]NII09633.1 glycine zipper 2TM domain-containing protein [Oleiagrimonas sp. C23AA]